MNDLERDTILAALRTWQGHRANVEDTDSGLWKIATNDGEHEAMTHEEIDELCERLNVPDGGQGGPDIIEKWNTIEAADTMSSGPARVGAPD